jgi:hypothetical protein
MDADGEFLVERPELVEAEAERFGQEVRDAASDPANQEEWIRQSNLIYGGLAAAAFWHISMLAGIVFLAVGCIAVGVHSSGYVQLEYGSKFRPRFPSRKAP